jgi:Domain of unknown function (DUF3597)
MSIFGSIASAIFGKGKTPGAPSLVPGASAAPASQGTATAGGAPATGKAMTLAEVEAMIKQIADAHRQHHKEKLDWQRSIVDLMKLLNLDSSLSARKQLAQELGYKGSLHRSAQMNVWLHKQVMTKLAETGGVVPESLKHA